ncbi:MAG: sulfite oxidase heme-binding subunit YedZ [Chloroflexota bacterium]
MGRRDIRWIHIVTHIGALTPLASLAWMFWQDQLGPAPVAAVIRLLGRYALALLLLSLVPTVIRTVTGFGVVMRVRRTLGLYAFLYTALHFLAFAGLDYRFDLGLIATTVAESRREMVGLAALAILAALALTSIGGVRKRLGRFWKPLHRLVYVAGGLVVLHTIWNYKELRTWPALAGGALVVLLAARVPAIAELLSRLRTTRPSGERQRR